VREWRTEWRRGLHISIFPKMGPIIRQTTTTLDPEPLILTLTLGLWGTWCDVERCQSHTNFFRQAPSAGLLLILRKSNHKGSAALLLIPPKIHHSQNHWRWGAQACKRCCSWTWIVLTIFSPIFSLSITERNQQFEIRSKQSTVKNIYTTIIVYCWLAMVYGRHTLRGLN
jgi:hypothetical protein